MPYTLPDDTIVERIDKALADWAAEGRQKPDRLFLGMRAIFALDRVTGGFCQHYKGMDVVLTNEADGVALARVY